MKRVLVTGANGFVGSTVCNLLLKYGFEVTALVRNKESDTSRLSDEANLHVVFLSLDEIMSLPDLVSTRDYEVFYHFGWDGSSGPKRADEKVQLRNVLNSCEAIKVAREMGCKRFVYAASIMEHEIQQIVRAGKNLNGNTIYSTAKLTADFMMRAIANEIGIEFVAGVISNVYGPGEFSPRLINSTIRNLVLGNYCKFSPCEQLYDFIYIDDAAQAFVLLGTESLFNQEYYIGNSSVKQLKYFIEHVRNIVSPDAKLGIGEIPFEGISLDYSCVCLSGLHDDFGFVPSVSFSEGIQKTYQWILNEERIKRHEQ